MGSASNGPVPPRSGRCRGRAGRPSVHGRRPRAAGWTCPEPARRPAHPRRWTGRRAGASPRTRARRGRHRRAGHRVAGLCRVFGGDVGSSPRRGSGAVVLACFGALDLVTLAPGELITVDPGHVVAYPEDRAVPAARGARVGGAVHPQPARVGARPSPGRGNSSRRPGGARDGQLAGTHPPAGALSEVPNDNVRLRTCRRTSPGVASVITALDGVAGPRGMERHVPGTDVRLGRKVALKVMGENLTGTTSSASGSSTRHATRPPSTTPTSCRCTTSARSTACCSSRCGWWTAPTLANLIKDGPLSRPARWRCWPRSPRHWTGSGLGRTHARSVPLACRKHAVGRNPSSFDWR